MGGVALSLGVFWPETTQSSGLWALWLGLMVNGKRVYAKGDLPRLVPHPCGELLMTHPPQKTLQH